MEKFVGMKFWLRKILLGMWCWFLENFAWLWKKDLVIVYGHVKNFDCGEIRWGIDFLLWGIGLFWVHDFFVMQNFLDMWLLVVRILLAWEFFFWVIWAFGCGNWWAKLLCCRASRVEVASKCWKVHGHPCLLASKTSSMKQALVLSLKLC